MADICRQARVPLNVLRAKDLLARLGDGFVVLLRDVALDEGLGIGERLRRLLLNLEWSSTVTPFSSALASVQQVREALAQPESCLAKRTERCTPPELREETAS